MTIFYLILLGGLGFFLWKKYFSKVDSSALKYFSGLMSAEKYDAYVKGLIESKNLRQVALSKFDLDESELKELPPLCLSDYYFDEKDEMIAVKKGRDGKDRRPTKVNHSTKTSKPKICLINKYYANNSFRNSLVYLAACEGLKNPEHFGKAFVDKGVKAVVGWDETNCLGAIVCKSLMYNLLNGNTLSKAYNLLPENERIDKHSSHPEANNPCPCGWRLPTHAEQVSLNNAGSKWTTLNGVNGRIFGSGNNTIFLPAAGCREDSGAVVSKRNGNYWSSSIFDDRAFYYWDFASDMNGANIVDRLRNALSVRCVAE